MKLIVGLGNPGSEYERTRHNAGFMALDRAARRFAPGALPRSKHGAIVFESEVGGEKALFLKPLNYMNRSGGPVAEVLNFHKAAAASDLLVIVDDYNLPLGSIRIREKGSDGNHNGLTDVIRALGTSEFPRLRIGVDPKPPHYSDPADWVLGRFSDDELVRLAPALDLTVRAVETFITRGTTAAMNAFNAPPREPPTTPKKPIDPPSRLGSAPSTPSPSGSAPASPQPPAAPPMGPASSPCSRLIPVAA
ncbi:MAG: aminoacyl-tRNA hydrolase [Phycisphaerales bacterium]